MIRSGKKGFLSYRRERQETIVILGRSARHRILFLTGRPSNCVSDAIKERSRPSTGEIHSAAEKRLFFVFLFLFSFPSGASAVTSRLWGGVSTFNKKRRRARLVHLVFPATRYATITTTTAIIIIIIIISGNLLIYCSFPRSVGWWVGWLYRDVVT